MSWTEDCPNCGEPKHRFRPCDSCGFASGNENTTQSARWGQFAVTDDAVDAIGLILDEDIRRARNEIHRRIENGTLNRNVAVGADAAENVTAIGQPLTTGAQTLAKIVTDLHAIQKQAMRADHRNR